MDKTQLMSLVTQNLIHECFTHEFYGTFDVTEIRKAAARGVFGRPWTSALYPDRPDLIEFIKSSRDVDPMRVLHFVQNQDQIGHPAIAILCPPNERSEEETDLIIDGTHR